MRRGQGDIERPHLDGHETLGAMAEADKDAFSRPQFREPIAAQSLHMDKNVLRSLALREKAKTARAVEPFDDRDLKSARLDHSGAGAGHPRFRRMHSHRFIN